MEIVIDMLTTEPLYDIAVLISGDGDFERAVETVRAKGKTIYACCCRGMTARDLVSSVDRFYYLEDMRSDLEYKGKGGAARQERHNKETFSEVKL